MLHGSVIFLIKKHVPSSKADVILVFLILIQHRSGPFYRQLYSYLLDLNSHLAEDSRPTGFTGSSSSQFTLFAVLFYVIVYCNHRICGQMLVKWENYRICSLKLGLHYLPNDKTAGRKHHFSMCLFLLRCCILHNFQIKRICEVVTSH